MNKPHKHAELIKAWADGAEIEFFDRICHAWLTCQKTPTWAEENSYRIKQEKKPDMVYYGVFSNDIGHMNLSACFTKLNEKYDHIKVTFDGETGELKSAEVL